MKAKHAYFIFFLCGACLLSVVFGRVLLRYAHAVVLRVKGKATISDKIEKYGSIVKERLAPDFERIKTGWPGCKMTLIGLKEEKVLEVWIADDAGGYKLLRTYPILKTSGVAGPKLREGDRQVPEGFYRIESLNPNSRFHLSLRLNYPNAFDREMARKDGRDNPGSDIIIHGGRVSIGCLAMGDPGAEDLFVLAAEIGLENIAVILSPVDFRNPDLRVDTAGMPDWIDPLYEQIREELSRYTNP